MRFYRHDTPTIMDGIVVRYKLEHYDGEISASRNGVAISGTWPGIQNIDDLSDLRRVLFRAHEHFVVLARPRYAYEDHPDPLPFKDDPDCVVEQRKDRVSDSPVNRGACRSSSRLANGRNYEIKSPTSLPKP